MDDDTAPGGLGPAIDAKLLVIEVKIDRAAGRQQAIATQLVAIEAKIDRAASLQQAAAAVMAAVQANAARIDDLQQRAEAHWANEERRMHLVDQFVDPELDLSSTLVQLTELLRRDHAAVAQVEQELRRLAAAVELALSAPPDAPTPPTP